MTKHIHKLLNTFLIPVELHPKYAIQRGNSYKHKSTKRCYLLLI